MARKPARPSQPLQPSEAPRRGRHLDAIPTWLQAIAAVASVVLTAVVVFGIVRQPNPATPATDQPSPPASAGPSATASGAEAEVSLESVVTAPSEVRASGTFRNLAAGRQVVLLIGQPVAGDDAAWLPAIATLHPEAGAGSLQSGRWEAVRTGASGQYRWYAVIAPYAPGAQDPFPGLRERGPDSELVVALSELVTTD